MRKADYAHLAQLLKAQRKVAIDNHNAWPNENADKRAYWDGYKQALSYVSTAFADKASVNWDDFVKACGIE